MTYPPPYGGYSPYGHRPQYGYGPPPQPGDRPQKATLGAMSMVTLAVLWMFTALMGVVFYNQVSSNMESWCKDTYSGNDYGYSVSDCTSQASTGGFQLFGNLVSFLWLLCFLGVALFALRGFNWARITSFILNGLSITWNLVVMICVGVSITAISSLSSTVGQSSDANVDELIPGWYLPSSLAVNVLSMIISIVSLVMMGNRESADWFRAHSRARQAGVI